MRDRQEVEKLQDMAICSNKPLFPGCERKQNNDYCRSNDMTFLPRRGDCYGQRKKKEDCSRQRIFQNPGGGASDIASVYPEAIC